MNVLIIPCGTEIASEIYRSLIATKGITLFGANAIPGIHETRGYEDYSNDSPYIDHPDFLAYTKNKIHEWDIDVIFPAHDDAALLLKENEDYLAKKVITSSLETNLICRDKSETYRYFRKYDFCPEVYSIKDLTPTSFPYFAKPKIGQGSKGARVIAKQSELEQLSDKDVVTEYLPGDEYTVDCFTDHNSSLRFIGPRIRARVQNGISVSSRTLTASEEFNEIAQAINNELELLGAWFFQVKRDREGKLKLLEIATRIAGSMATHRMKGINFSELSILSHQGIEIAPLPNSLDIRMERALENKYVTDVQFKDVFVDFDDCLIQGPRVNVTLISFLYSCRNDGKKITIISRHAKDLSSSLKEYALSEVADDVIHITDKNLRKSNFITQGALFIDDSFRERLDVQSNTDALVIAPDQVELFNL